MEEEGCGWRERDGASVSTATCTDTNRASSHRRGSRGSWPPGIIVSPGLSLSLLSFARLPLACYLDKDTRSSASRVGRRRGNSLVDPSNVIVDIHASSSLAMGPPLRPSLSVSRYLEKDIPGSWPARRPHRAESSRVESSRVEARDETRRRRTPRTWIIVILLSSRPPPPPVDAVDLALVRSFLHLPTYIPASRKKDVRTEMSERRYPWKMESREDSRGRTRPR